MLDQITCFVQDRLEPIVESRIRTPLAVVDSLDLPRCVELMLARCVFPESAAFVGLLRILAMCCPAPVTTALGQDSQQAWCRTK